MLTSTSYRASRPMPFSNAQAQLDEMKKTNQRIKFSSRHFHLTKQDTERNNPGTYSTQHGVRKAGEGSAAA
jgi:hypothetical protein